eukprot:scaffold47137_cov37-Attheya_sp.AAC.1
MQMQMQMQMQSDADVDVDADVDPVTEVIWKESMEEMERLEEYYLLHQKNEPKKKMPVFLQSKEQVSHYMDRQFDTIIFDCDGVLYRGKHLIPEVAQTLQSLLLKKKKNVLFVTNNDGSNRHQLREKLSDMLNCPSLRIDQIISSSYSCANYLQHRHHLLSSIKSDLGNNKQIKHVFVVGTEGLCDELRAAGLSTVSVPDTEPHSMSRDELAVHDFEGLYYHTNNNNDDGMSTIITNRDVDAVVVGLDTEFSYRKLCVATVLLQKFPNAPLVATNRDAFDLVGQDGRRLPGNGSLVAALECASQ